MLVYPTDPQAVSEVSAPPGRVAERTDLGEERMTQFYWDLRDTKDANGIEPDSERWSGAAI